MAKQRIILGDGAPETFKVTVLIPIPGGTPSAVQFTFIHRDEDAFREWVDGVVGKSGTQIVMEIATGWDLEDAFGPENVERLLVRYMGSGKAIMDKYISENCGARLGN